MGFFEISMTRRVCHVLFSIKIIFLVLSILAKVSILIIKMNHRCA